MSEYHYVRTGGVEGGVDAVDGPAIGIDLESILKDGLPPFNVALTLIAGLCEILDIADQDGEIHGDIAPDWVFLDDTGAISVEGFGTDRDETMAPEGVPDSTATDLYGLGYLAYRLFSIQDLPEVDLDDPDAHDDGIIDAVLEINFDGLPEEIIGDVQWFVAKLMSFEPDDRPTALEAWRSFVAFADFCEGPAFEDWSRDAMDGLGERRDADAASRPMGAPADEVEDLEDLGGVVQAKGPLSRGGLSFGGSGAKGGAATAFWSKDQLKAALESDEEEEEDETFRPAVGGGAATSFWTKDQMEAMARGDNAAPRPKRGSGQAGSRATMMVQRSDLEVQQTRQKRSAPRAAPPPTPSASPPRGQPASFQPSAPQPAPPAQPEAPEPPPVAGPTAQPAVAAGPQPGFGAQPADGSMPAFGAQQTGFPVQGPTPYGDVDEGEGGGKGKLIAIGVAVVAVIVCAGVLALGGGGALFMSMGDAESSSASTTDQADDDQGSTTAGDDRRVKDTAPDGEEEQPEPLSPGTRSGSSSSRSSGSSTRSSSSGSSTRSSSSGSSTRSSSSGSSSSGSSTRSSSSGSSTRSSSSGSSTRSSSSSSVRPRSTPTPTPAASGPIRVTFNSATRGQLRSSDGQQVDFDGGRVLEFDPYDVPGTCMGMIEGVMGAVQLSQSGSVTCNLSGGEVGCR